MVGNQLLGSAAAAVMTDETLENMVLMLLATPGMSATGRHRHKSCHQCVFNEILGSRVFPNSNSPEDFQDVFH